MPAHVVVAASMHCLSESANMLRAMLSFQIHSFPIQLGTPMTVRTSALVDCNCRDSPSIASPRCVLYRTFCMHCKGSLANYGHHRGPRPPHKNIQFAFEPPWVPQLLLPGDLHVIRAHHMIIPKFHLCKNCVWWSRIPNCPLLN